MSNTEEWLRLPHGFRDFSGEDFLFFMRKANAFVEVAEEINAEIVVTPPVGFASTFLNKINTTGNKTYDFLDKKGRELMLSPDSSPHVARWFLTNYEQSTNKRILFISPVFRYRNIKDRWWIQFGFSSFNEENKSEALVTLARGYIKVLVDKLDLPVKLQVNDISIFRNFMVENGLNIGEVEDIVNILRSAELDEQFLVIDRLDINKNKKLAVKELLSLSFSSEDNKHEITKRNEVLNKNLILKVLGVKEISDKIVNDFNVFYECVFNDFHASELQDGIAIKFKKPDKGHYADGGDYTFYGQKLDPGIESWISFGGGLKGARKILDS